MQAEEETPTAKSKTLTIVTPAKEAQEKSKTLTIVTPGPAKEAQDAAPVPPTPIPPTPKVKPGFEDGFEVQNRKSYDIQSYA